MVNATVGRASLITIGLLISQGADNTYAFRYSEMISNVKTPVNLTGYSARGQIRSGAGRPLWLDLGDLFNLDSEGNVVFTIVAAATEGAVWDTRKTGVWDMELIDPDGGVVRFASGPVTVSPDVTRNV